MRWCIFVKNLETTVRIGIHRHEKTAQRLRVSADIEMLYAQPPQTIADCFNYDHIYRLVCEEWPKGAHVDLLETLAVDFLNYVFTMDSRVDSAKVRIAKPDIFAEAEEVGVETRWTREDFKRLTS